MEDVTSTLSMKMAECWAESKAVLEVPPKWTVGGVGCSGTVRTASACVTSRVLYLTGTLTCDPLFRTYTTTSKRTRKPSMRKLYENFSEW